MKHVIYILLTLLVATDAFAQTEREDHMHDSLLNVLNTLSPNDTSRMAALNMIGYMHYSVDTVKKYSEILLSDAERLNYKRSGYYKTKALGYLYWCCFHDNDLTKANMYANRAIAVADSAGERKLEGANYHNLGISYAAMKDATKADEYYHKALEIFKETKDSASISDVLRNMGYNNTINEMYSEAIDRYREAIEFDRKRGDTNSISEDYVGLGSVLFERAVAELEANDSLLLLAKNDYLEAIRLAEANNYEYTLFITYAELPMVMLAQMETGQANGTSLKAQLDSCKMFLNKGYSLANKFGYDIDRLELDFVWATYLTRNGEYRKAEMFLDSLSNLFATDEEAYTGKYGKLYNVYAALSQSKGQYKEALKYQKMSQYYYNKGRDQDYAIKATQSMAQAQFDEQMREHKHKEQLLEAETRQQSVIQLATMIVLVLLTLMMILIVRMYMRSRNINMELDSKNTELEQQKEEMLAQNELLEEQNQRIEEQRLSLEKQNDIISDAMKSMTDSINYASVIQKAVLPSQRLMNSIFGDNVAIYQPLDIVSGDFYWATQTSRFKMLAVADCTGHGVPGAFLSMLGIAILDYMAPVIERSQDEVSAGMALDEIRRMFKTSLHQRGYDDESHDGIDMALVIFDTEKQEMHYAGAFRPMILMHDGKAVKVDADRMPIGVHYKESDHFTDHTYAMTPGDVIYLYSDGMTDQFGYDEKLNVHKFTGKRMRQLLTDIHKLPFTIQKAKIMEALISWRSNSRVNDGTPYEQTDDAVLVGIRI